jgi:MYXO-CTERM domain-containing protein
VAIGDGNFSSAAAVHFFSMLAFSPESTQVPVGSVTSPNFDAAWDTDGRLYVTGGRSTDFASVMTRIDLGAGGAAGVATEIMTNIGNGSGGVAVDAAGNRLITGVGFSFGGETGVIRSFDLTAAGALGSAIQFGTGTFVAQVLTAYPLGFDEAGNVLVAGGDTFSFPEGPRFAAVVDPSDPQHPLLLAPSGPASLYSARFNFALDELLVSDGTTIFRYAVPGPGAFALLGIGASFAVRRRRHAF